MDVRAPKEKLHPVENLKTTSWDVLDVPTLVSHGKMKITMILLESWDIDEEEAVKRKKKEEEAKKKAEKEALNRSSKKPRTRNCLKSLARKLYY